MYGIIDIGSNTIRLVLYIVRDGKILPMLNKKFTAGLAGYIKKGHMSDKGKEKLIEVLLEFRHILTHIKTAELFCIATAPLRNIDNTKEISAAVLKRTGFSLTVLSGEEEALYDYYGAMQSVQEPSGLVIDIGGGSTEFVFYADNTVKSVFSLPIGSLTAYSTYVKSILPNKKEEKLIAEAIREAAADLPKERPEVICGVGGSIRAAVKIYNELFEDTLPAGRVELKKLQTLLKIPQGTLAKAILKVAPERIHTFIPGLILLCTIAEMWGITKISVSTSGVKEGYLAARLQERGVL